MKTARSTHYHEDSHPDRETTRAWTSDAEAGNRWNVTLIWALFCNCRNCFPEKSFILEAEINSPETASKLDPQIRIWFHDYFLFPKSIPNLQ